MADEGVQSAVVVFLRLMEGQAIFTSDAAHNLIHLLVEKQKKKKFATIIIYTQHGAVEPFQPCPARKQVSEKNLIMISVVLPEENRAF